MNKEDLIEFIEANQDHEVIVLCEVCGTEVVFMQRFAASEFNAKTFEKLPVESQLPVQIVETEKGSKHIIIGDTEKDVS